MSYSGVVQWTSNGGVFLQFPESGQLTTTNTNITISPLTPSTLYMLKVSVITANGEGADVMEKRITVREIGGRDQAPSNYRDTHCSVLMPLVAYIVNKG